MQHTITSLPKSRVEITVTLPFSEFEPHVKRAAVKISEEKGIEGFRRGKAPYDIVKQRFGEAAIYEEAAEIAVRSTYPKMAQDITEQWEKESKEFLPIGKPDITVTKLAPGNELAYKITLSLLPRVNLPSSYKDIARRVRGSEKTEVAATDDEVTKTIDWIRDSRTKIIAVDRPAKEGDAVEIDFEVKRGGVKIKGGEGHNHAFILGKGQFLPGFEDRLTGMSRGEEKEFDLPVPEDWREKSIAGQTLNINVKMKAVQKKIVPPLDDEFAKQLGSFDSVAKLQSIVAAGIKTEKEEKEKQRVRLHIIEEIAKQSVIDLPDVLVEAEKNKMQEELKRGVRDSGLEWESYLSHMKKTEEELMREWSGQAEARSRVALCLGQIAREEGIKPEDKEVEERANTYLKQFQSPEKAQKDIDPERLRAYTQDVLRNEKVFEFLENV